MARPKEFNQDEVLSKAIQIFWIKGYSATTLQDLVDGLGISRSSLYGTYTDKHTLFVSALASYQQSAAAKISHITENTVSAKETVLKLLSFTMNALSDDLDHRGCFMVNSEVEMGPHDAEVSRLLCRNDLQMEEALYQVIQKGIVSGEINNGRSGRVLARFIFNNIKGMRLTANQRLKKLISKI